MNRTEYEESLKRTNSSSGSYCDKHFDKDGKYIFYEMVREETGVRCPICKWLVPYEKLSGCLCHPETL